MKLTRIFPPFAPAAAGRPVLSWAICPQTGRPLAVWTWAPAQCEPAAGVPPAPAAALDALIARHRMLRAA